MGKRLFHPTRNLFAQATYIEQYTNQFENMNLIKIILAGFILFLIYYFGMPTWSWDNPNLYGLLVFLFLLGIPLSLKTGSKYGSTTLNWSKGSSVFTILSVLALFVWIGGEILSWSWPNEDEYFELIGDIEVKDFESDVAPIDQSKIIVIDKETAARLGDKTLVADTGKAVVGSQVVIGDYWLQKVNNGFYYVAPTLHTSFWKYRRNKEGTDGYIMVNAINEKDVQYVDNYRLRFQPNACWSDNLERHLYMNGYNTTYLDKLEFEINDQGHPYWIIPRYQRTIGFRGKQVDGAILVDAVSGEITEYDTADVPAWVDRIQPQSIVYQQLQYWGDLPEGYWNWQDLNKKSMTDGMVMMYGQDDRCYYYTGVTSVGKDGATIGFITIDSRTKKATMYRKAGATENKAMKSAVGAAASQMGWEGARASYPRTYNINGVPTYVMALKDTEGLIKMVAMVSVENYETVAIGSSVKRALREYRSKLNSSFSDLVINEDELQQVITAEVIRLNQDASNGMVYLFLDGVPKIVTVDPEMYPEAMITDVGDVVAITLYEGEDATTGVDLFDNLDLRFEISNEQLQLEYDLENPVKYKQENKLIPDLNETDDPRKQGEIPAVEGSGLILTN